MVTLLKIKRRDFFSATQYSYYGVTHCENSEVQITVFRKETCYGTGTCTKIFFVYLQPSVNKNWWNLAIWGKCFLDLSMSLMLMCVWPQKHYLFLFLQNFKRWKGRVIWSNFFTTFFCLGGRSWVQGPESSPAFFNRICPKHNMTSRQDNTMHKRQDHMTSRQDDMTNSIMESRPIETFASKCKFVCQSK